MLNALDVANWFVSKANSQIVDELPEGISNMKLQKILYFAQAAHIVIHNKPLFKEEIEAWQYGPVVDVVYQEFKSFKNAPIKKVASNSYEETIDDNTALFLNSTWDIFGKYSAAKLVQMTHDHRPWKEAYRATNKTITKSALKQYYKDSFTTS